MNHRESLKRLLVRRSLKTGDFTLASGARSSYYVDARRTSMCAEGQFLTGKVCFEVLRDTGLKPSHVGGLTMGADPIAYAIAHESWQQGVPIDGFSIRKEPKGHGTGQQIEGGLPDDASCVVIEDSMTSGGSALKACRVLENAGVEIQAVLTLIDREEGGRERVEEAGYDLIAVFTAAELLEASRSSAT